MSVTEEKDMVGAVMVVGAGIAGMQAALDLSAGGFMVYVVEESPSIGGNMARLDKTFPTGDCATCTISPKLVACMRDLNIELITMAEVVALDGEAGGFKARVKIAPRSVDASKCTGCGDCTEFCPVRNIVREVGPYRPPQVDDADLSKVDEILQRHSEDRGGLMPILQDIGKVYGFLPRRIMGHVAAGRQLPLAEVMRVATFYEEFRHKPEPRHIIEVCDGTSCYSRHSSKLRKELEKKLGIKAGESDEEGRFALRTVRCLGLCALSPVMRVDGVSFGRMSMDRIPQILERFE
jgi:NADH:ubiquinone oxidoreductase subunit E